MFSFCPPVTIYIYAFLGNVTFSAIRPGADDGQHINERIEWPSDSASRPTGKFFMFLVLYVMHYEIFIPR